MASKDLKVEELRAQLAQRGLSTVGIKSALVQRLDATIREESKKSADADGCTRSSRKRQRDSDNNDADSEAPVKIKAVDDLRSMNLKQLREEASVRGVSAAGTKKELLERLCADNNNVSGFNDQVHEETKQENANSLQEVKVIDDLRKMNIKQLREEAAKRGISAAGTKKELLERLSADNDNVSSDKNPVKEDKEEKIVTAMKKGSAVLDKWLPDHIKAQYHVLQVGDEIYDATLNQTNVGKNNNKFFVIQVLGYTSIHILSIALDLNNLKV